MAHVSWWFGQRKWMRFLKGFLVLGMCASYRRGVYLSQIWLRSISRWLPWASSLILGWEGMWLRRLCTLTCLLPTSTRLPTRELAFRGHPSHKTPHAKGYSTSSAHSPSRAEPVRFCRLGFNGGFGFNFLCVVLVLRMRTDVPNSTIPGTYLGAFLLSRASLMFQLASHKQICLQVLRILILGLKWIHEVDSGSESTVPGGYGQWAREKSHTSVVHGRSQWCVQSVSWLSFV